MEGHGHDGCNSIEGAWVLDLARSDSMERFLLLSKVPEEGIRAHIRAEMQHGGFNAIHLDEDTITIYKRTYAHNYTESYTLDEEKVKYDGVARTRISEVLSISGSGPAGYTRSANSTTTHGRDNVHMFETRYLIEGGRSHAQEIRLHNLTTGEDCVTNRFWTRVAMTHEHRATVGLLVSANGAQQ